MNGWTTRACVTALVLAGLAAAAPAQVENNDQAEVLLQEARHKALVDGDLERAIELCKKTLAEYSGNRAVAAKALVLIGQCHEKLGKAAARKAYQRVIQDYADQREQAAVARARLSALGHAPSSATASGMTIRRVWDITDVDLESDVSPDGRYVFFQDRKTGDLSVRDLVTGKNRRLTKNEDSEQSTGDAALSPDGNRVAYAWHVGPRSRDLRLIGFDGSDPRVLYRHEELEDIDPVGWTSDGGHILVKLSRKDRTVQIAWIAVADGSLRVLKTLGWEGRYANVRLSPDGQYVAYDHHLEEEGPSFEDISVLASDGSRETLLVKHPSDDDVVAWAPDGKWVLFRSDRLGGNSLWAIPVADGKPQGSPQLIKRDIGGSGSGVTRGGAFYYLASGSAEMVDVYIASLDPATGKVLTRATRATQRFTGSTFAPAWSPDGKSLAYLVQVQPWANIIRIRSLETGEERELPPRLAARWSRGFGPAMHWSPDGRSILLKVGRGCQQVDVQTGEVASLVTTVGHFGQGVLSSDGNLFFLSLTRENETTIVRRNLATGEERELIRIPHATGPFFALSPDERHLVFADPMVSQATALKIIPAAGGEVRELLSLKEPTKQYISQEAGFAWSPDGSHVYFGRRSEWPKRTIQLCRIPVEGGEPQVVGLEIKGLSELCIHPDGRRIAFAAIHQQETRELWVMENFLPALKAGK